MQMLWHSLANICIELHASICVGYLENIHTLMKTENVLVDIQYQIMDKKKLRRSNNATAIAFHVVIKMKTHLNLQL